MKALNIIKITAVAVALSAALSACDADYQQIGNSVYISESSPSGTFSQHTETVTVDGETVVSLHIRLAQTCSEDITVNLALDESIVSAYNNANGTDWQMLPEQYVSFAKSTVIEAGSIASSAVDVTIAVYPTDGGEAYCIPIVITSVTGTIPVAEGSGKIIYLLTAPHKQLVPMMTYKNQPTGSDNWGISTSEWTLEGWIWMSSFTINNQAIWSGKVSQGTEIYVRFGDADVAYNKLQIKTYGSQFNSNATFETNTWYHVAFVTANGKCTMYINGEEDSSMELSGTDYIIENMSFCSSGSTYFKANCQMAQVRFWSKGLEQSAIQAAMNRQVPVNSEGLFAYWKMDEGEGGTYYDSTINGYDLTCSVDPTWSTEVVDFSNPNG